MAGPNYVLDKAFLAQTAFGTGTDGPDLASSYDYFVAVKAGTVADSVTAITATTDTVLGVAQQRIRTADINKEYVDVRILGITKMLVGTGGVTFGSVVAVSATGTAVAAGAAGSKGIGIALQTGVAADVVDVLLTPGVTV